MKSNRNFFFPSGETGKASFMSSRSRILAERETSKPGRPFSEFLSTLGVNGFILASPLYGEILWDLLKLIDKWDNRAATLVLHIFCVCSLYSLHEHLRQHAECRE